MSNLNKLSNGIHSRSITNNSWFWLSGIILLAKLKWTKTLKILVSHDDFFYGLRCCNDDTTISH